MLASSTPFEHDTVIAEMAGKRHHTIPRFLLKGFASSTRGDEVNVWMYRRAKLGIELNIKNVSVEKDFYGTEQESDLDSRITDLEQTYSSLVGELRDCTREITQVSNAEIPALISHLSMRTRHIQQFTRATFDSVLGMIGDQVNREDVMKELLVREFGRDGEAREGLKALLVRNGVAVENLDKAMAQIQPHLRDIVGQPMPSLMPELQTRTDEYIEISRSVLPGALRSAFIGSLSRNLDNDQRSASYREYTWFVFRTSSRMLLGDTVCVFETRGERRFKPIDEKDDTVHRAYLPLASDAVLVGTPFKSKPRIDAKLLNKAIARCSYEFFVSSQALPANSSLIEGLGKWAGILSAKEVQELVLDLKSNILKD